MKSDTVKTAPVKAAGDTPGKEWMEDGDDARFVSKTPPSISKSIGPKRQRVGGGTSGRTAKYVKPSGAPKISKKMVLGK